MTDLSFVFHSLKSRWLNCLLSILLTAFGVSIAVLITQFGNNIKDRLKKDGANIDLVVGAKGSPIQLILSSVYHIDIPTGNISWEAAQKLIKHPQIKKAIPVALGDNWKGNRIIGTTIDYLEHYNAELKKGKLWDNKFEVVVGSSVKLDIDDEIVGAHGLYDGGEIHGDKKYKVIGIIKPTKTVLDRLIFTSINSVLDIHGIQNIDNHEEVLKSNHNHFDHDDHKTDSDEVHSESEVTHSHHDEHSHANKKTEHEHDHKDNNQDIHNGEQKTAEITALLLTTNSPIANINLPRYINKNTSFQAANPALEITRLTSMLGVGAKSFAILSFILIIVAALSVFSGLAANLENRMSDLAILRAIGYTKKRIFKIICLDGIMIIISGILVGVILSIIIFEILNYSIITLNTVQAKFSLTSDLLFIIIVVFFSGLIAAIFPAIRASKISVAKQLSQNI